MLAGGAGGRLELLTATRAKPAVPFAGVYRLVDFPLSNCQHSGIADVWVSIQQHPASLAEHLANGRPWDLDRTAGGMLTLPQHQGSERAGWHSGTADSLWRNAPSPCSTVWRTSRARPVTRGSRTWATSCCRTSSTTGPPAPGRFPGTGATSAAFTRAVPTRAGRAGHRRRAGRPGGA